MLKKISKYFTWSFIVVLAIACIVGILFVNLSPEFGGDHSEQDQKRYEDSGHYEKGKFINLIPTAMDMGAADMGSTLVKFIQGTPNSRPDFDVPIELRDSTELAQTPANARLIWFGHSAFLLQMDDKNILLDPMFGEVPAPHPLLGNPRFTGLPLEIDKLPVIDAIVLSHDHYDHLDYGSIERLKNKTKKYYVPLGVGAHLRSWGIAPEQIQELNWWDESRIDSITLAFAPARHFSGRGLSDRFNTLWGSWVIQGKERALYFSGDGGYGPHFKEIGDRYGPFDFAMMECGQYNEMWADIHMMPEETAQAAMDVKTKLMMPIHWGTFTLALHPWTEPVERVSAKARELGVPLTTPKIGQMIVLGEESPMNPWWIKPE